MHNIFKKILDAHFPSAISKEQLDGYFTDRFPEKKEDIEEEEETEKDFYDEARYEALQDTYQK